MYAVDTKETIHIYYERETEAKPFVVFPLLCALLCLLGVAACTLYSAEHPYYEHASLTLPAVALPPQTFTASVTIVPTGVKTYPATTAHGMLTITNGSVISQTIPQGFRVENVVTDTAVYVPAGSANGYGVATVSAHAVAAGKSGNIPAYAINSVIGSSTYIRNLSAFTGGRDSYSVRFATRKDKQAAFEKARQQLAVLSAGLHYPCVERINRGVSVTWSCNYITYRVPAFYHVTGIKIQGKNLLLTVWFVARPAHIWVK